jgi:ribosomal protein S18 acetylase RimI-like enzyme
MEVRRVRPEEWQALRDLRLRALEADPDAFGNTHAEASQRADDDWRAYADRPDGAAFVATTPDGFVGMASGGPAPGHPDAAGLFGMWVAPEARGQGVGSALVDAVEAWAREAGYENIGLGVTTTNLSAIRLYTAKGYSATGDRMPLRDGTDLMIQIMARRL